MPDLSTIDQLIGRAVRESHVDSIFVASTPSEDVYWFSLTGVYKHRLIHKSDGARTHPVSIPLVVLEPQVNRLLSRGSVSLGLFRHSNQSNEWKTWEINNVEVIQDLASHEVSVDFKVTLDGDKVTAESFNYTVDLYLGF